MGPQGALGATKLLRPFSEIVDSLGLKDPFIRNWIDLLAFLLAGVKSDGILSAEMVTIYIYPHNGNFNLMSITICQNHQPNVSQLHTILTVSFIPKRILHGSTIDKRNKIVNI